MNAVVKLKPPAKPADALTDLSSPPVSPERAALATAITAHAKLQARHDGAFSARDMADRAVWAARQRVDDAPELIERAKENEARRLIDMARGIDSPATQTIREARNLLQDAQDDLEAAEASRDGLRIETESVAIALIWSKSKLQDAAEAVVRAEATGLAHELAAEVIRLQHDMLRKAQALEWLARRGALPLVTEPGSLHGQVKDPATWTAIERLRSPPCTWNAIINVLPGVQPWDATMAALQLDAMAPLPVVAVV